MHEASNRVLVLTGPNLSGGRPALALHTSLSRCQLSAPLRHCQPHGQPTPGPTSDLLHTLQRDERRQICAQQRVRHGPCAGVPGTKGGTAGYKALVTAGAVSWPSATWRSWSLLTRKPAPCTCTGCALARPPAPLGSTARAWPAWAAASVPGLLRCACKLREVCTTCSIWAILRAAFH